MFAINIFLLISLICFRIIGLSLGAIQRPDYDDTPNPEFLNPSWMASIPNERPLSHVTMPGTHNTMALYGGVYAECESWSLASQLKAGIRFLDIRVRHVQGNLTIHHGVSYQRAHFGQVLDGVVDFLQEYPSETVLMRLKEEFSETRDIYGAVVDYIHRYAHWDLLWHSRLVPAMGEARGKLIILQEFSGPDLGMRYASLDIADDWKVQKLKKHNLIVTDVQTKHLQLMGESFLFELATCIDRYHILEKQFCYWNFYINNQLVIITSSKSLV